MESLSFSRLTAAEKSRAGILLLERERRRKISRLMRRDSFKQQWGFVTSPAKFRAAFTTRRAGKSMGAALKILLTGELFPKCSMVYTGLTDQSALDIIWKDCLKPASEKYGIQVKLREKGSSIEVNFANGSKLHIIGINTKPDDMKKVFGKKLKLVVIDEGALYTQDIERFINTICMPATADLRGEILFIGMPDENTHSYFFRVTNEEEPGWEVHRWTCFDNVHVKEQMQEQVERFKLLDPQVEKKPWFRNQYLGEWCIDSAKRIYCFDESDFIEKLPDGNYYYVLGVDLGYNDPTAFVLFSYKDYDPDLYIVFAKKEKGLDITSVANRIKWFSSRYGQHKTIIDGSHKQAVREMEKRHGISLVPAEKGGKDDFMKLLDDDLKAGRIKVLKGQADPLIKEWDNLAWDEGLLKKGIYKEGKKAINHCADAALYAWRYCFNYIDRGSPEVMPTSDEEKIDAWFEKQAAIAKRQSSILDTYGRIDIDELLH